LKLKSNRLRTCFATDSNCAGYAAEAAVAAAATGVALNIAVVTLVHS